MARKPKDPVTLKTAKTDDRTHAIIFEGASKSQLCDLFGMDIRTVNRRLAASDVTPSGTRNSHDIYAVRDVAGWLVSPKMDVEAYLRRMNPQDLPKTLSKEFWAGMKSRQDYRLRENELWETEEVHACLSEMVQIMVMSSRTIEDQVDRISELSQKQREAVRLCLTNLLNSVRETAHDHFKERLESKKQEEDGEPLDKAEAAEDGECDL